jgi:hypothetical protein
MKALNLIWLPLFLLSEASAQTTKTDQAIQTSLDILGQIVKKKKKNSDAGNDVAMNTNVKGTSASKNSNNGVKAGDLAPGAVSLDVDRLYPFNKGAALVKKGIECALIDTKGNFIVPFGEYDIYDYGAAYGIAGSAYVVANLDYGWFRCRQVTGNRMAGVLTSTGKFYEDGSNNESYTITNDGKYLELLKNGYNVLIDTAGHKFNIASTVEYINLRVGKIGPVGKEQLSNLKGEALSKPYFEIFKFCDGLACVQTTDQFGKTVYGFINEKGQEVVSPQFSIRPKDFSEGYAIVYPADQSEFRCAYINTKGEIVLKVAGQKFNGFGEFRSFAHGYVFSRDYAMDTTWNIISMKDFFAQYGIVQTKICYLLSTDLDHPVYDGKMRYENNGAKILDGFFDLKTKKVVECVFNSSNLPIQFDKTSGLSYAESWVKDKNGNDILRQGYINDDGAYVIVKGKQSVW